MSTTPEPESSWIQKKLSCRLEDLDNPLVDECLALIKPRQSLVEAVTACLKWLYPPGTLPAEFKEIILILQSGYGGFHSNPTLDPPGCIQIWCQYQFITHIIQNRKHFVERLISQVARALQGVTMPQQLASGFADYVLLCEGASLHLHAVQTSSHWLEGYATTAKFLVFVERMQGRGVVSHLFKYFMDNDWEYDLLQETVSQLIGADVGDMWDTYLAAEAEAAGNAMEDEDIDVIHDEPMHNLRPSPEPAPPYQWPMPTFRLVIKDLNHPGTKAFFANVDANTALSTAIVSTFNRLYTFEDVPRHVRTITLVLRTMDEIAYTMGSEKHKEIHISINHLESKGRRIGYEVLGVLTEQLVRCYQYSSPDCPFGLVDGIAAFVRLREGLPPLHWVRYSDGSWEDAKEDVWAHFLDWMEWRFGDGTVRSLNFRIKEGFSQGLFRELTGMHIDNLWIRYRNRQSSDWGGD